MHFIKDEIGIGMVNVVKVPSEVKPADMLSKPLPLVKFRNFLNLIGIINLWVKFGVADIVLSKAWTK